MPSLKTSENIDTVQFEEQAAAPATPAAGFARVYVNNTPQLAWRDDGGTIHLVVDGGAGGEIPLVDLASYARGNIIRGGAADWEAYDAKTLGAVLIGDGTDIISDTTPTFVGQTVHSAGGVLGTGGNTSTFSAVGALTQAGTARVTVDSYVNASGVKAPGAKPATFVEHGLTGVWQFADAILANQEHISGTLKLPSQMDKTAVPIFKVGWSADGISPGDCEWQLEYLYIGPDDDTAAVAQETLTATGTASATANGLVITPFAGVDLPGGADQAMLFKLTRLSADANDTIADTVELRGMLFTHTRDKLGTAT